jgi:ElaB/YqjD/DUF883 family membrane-anchored ribosome-binding protein
MAGTANAGASTASNGGDGGVKEQAQEKAQEVREQAGEQVRKATGQARDRARDQVDQRSTQLGEQVHGHANDLRDVAQQLRDQGKEGPAKIADQVADRAHSAGSWMKESDADRILSDVEDFARSNPWAVAAGGLALGFVASRVLKASSSRRYEQRGTAATAGQLPPAGGTTPARPGVRDPLATPTPGVSDPLAAPTPAPPGTAPAPVIDDPLRTPTPRTTPGGGL